MNFESKQPHHSSSQHEISSSTSFKTSENNHTFIASSSTAEADYAAVNSASHYAPSQRMPFKTKRAQCFYAADPKSTPKIDKSTSGDYESVVPRFNHSSDQVNDIYGNVADFNFKPRPFKPPHFKFEKFDLKTMCKNLEKTEVREKTEETNNTSCTHSIFQIITQETTAASDECTIPPDKNSTPAPHSKYLSNEPGATSEFKSTTESTATENKPTIGPESTETKPTIESKAATGPTDYENLPLEVNLLLKVNLPMDLNLSLELNLQLDPPTKTNLTLKTHNPLLLLIFMLTQKKVYHLITLIRPQMLAR